MLAGMVMSAVLGGLVGLGFSLTQDHTVLQTLLSYQLGGMTTFLAYLAISPGREASGPNRR